MSDPPYLRIAADMRARIASGEWEPGARVPSTRQVTRDWGVAMATATKALALLRDEGAIEVVRGVGAVVARPAAPRRQPSRRPPAPRPDLPVTLGQLIETAITVADAEGLAAVTMRRLAAEAGVGTMSLYRYVTGKDDLVNHMIDAAFGEVELPDPGPPGWRAKLELLSRQQWDLCRRHTWLPPLVSSVVRPPLAPNAMAHTEWALAAFAETGLDMRTRLALTMTSSGYVIGMGTRWSAEVDAEQDSGITGDQYLSLIDAAADMIFATGRYPQLDSVGEGDLMDFDTLFEFGLQCHLDGVAALIDRRR